MASFPSSDITNCGVCLEPYSTSSGSEHIPLCLPPPCGHTFCLGCCRALIKGKRVLCPECRCSSSVNNVNDLLRNFTMMAFLDAAASSQSQESSLDQADKSTPFKGMIDDRCANHVDGCSKKASSYCPVCVVCLCQSCAAASHKVGFMKTHKLGPMSERQVRCPVHSDQICDLVVTDSQEIICLKCRHGKFQGMEVRPIQEVSAEVMAELKKQLPALSSMSNALATQKASLTKDVQSIKDNATACHAQVDDNFHPIEEAIAAKKRELHDEIEVFQRAQIQAAEEQLQANLVRTESMVELEQKIKFLASGSSDQVTLLSSFADLRAELNTQEASVTQLLNQAGAKFLSLNQDVDALRKQVTDFASLTIETDVSAQMSFTAFSAPLNNSTTSKQLEAITPEEIEAKKLADDGTINELMSDYHTPLTKSSLDNDLDMVKALIKFGADVNGKDGSWNFTPLHWASHEGHEEVVKVLLAVKGIDVNAKDEDENGMTALNCAVEYGHSEVAALLRSAGAK